MGLGGHQILLQPVKMHLCHGNFKGLWLTQGGYDYVAQRMFNEVDADVFLLE